MSDHHAAISTLEDMIRRLELDVERRTQDVEKLRDECARFDAAIARDRGIMDQHRATIAHLKGAVTVDVLKRIDDQTNGAGFNTVEIDRRGGCTGNQVKEMLEGTWAKAEGAGGGYGGGTPSEKTKAFLKTVAEGTPKARPE